MKQPSKTHQARSVARLAAVQAMYQMETAGAGVETVVREFSDHRFGGDLEGSSLAEADEAFFGELVRGVVADQGAVDKAIARRLAVNWRLERIAIIDRLILRMAAFELQHVPETPAPVVMNEAVELARTFSGDESVPFVNGVLDAMRKSIGKAEVANDDVE